MDAEPVSHDFADTQNAVSGAKPLSPSPLSPSQSRSFSTQHEEVLPSLPVDGETGEFGSVLPQVDCLILADLSEDHIPFTALDSLLRDMENGKGLSRLHVPVDYRKSMVNLSDQSLVPKPVNPRKQSSPHAAGTWTDQSDAKSLNEKPSLCTILPASPNKHSPARQDNLNFPVSASSSSVDSEHSSGGSKPEARILENSLSTEEPTRCSKGSESSADAVSTERGRPCQVQGSNSTPDQLDSEPLQRSEPTSADLTGNSPTCQTGTFLLDDSSTESTPLSPLSIYRSSASESLAKKNQSDTCSVLASSSSRSSGKVSELETVRPCHDNHYYWLTTLVIDRSLRCDGQSCETPWTHTRQVNTAFLRTDNHSLPILLWQSEVSVAHHANYFTICDVKT
jgi:hypothetical protein